MSNNLKESKAELRPSQNFQITEVKMNGWDLINAGTFEAVNASIIAQNTAPTLFELASTTEDVASLKGQWGTWALGSGSAGGTVAMDLPIISGTAELPDMSTQHAKLATPLEGQLDSTKTIISAVSPAVDAAAYSNVAAASGKFYFEAKRLSALNPTSSTVIGLATNTDNAIHFDAVSSGYGFRSSGLFKNASLQTRVADATWETVGDIVRVAVDIDGSSKTAKIWFAGTDGLWIAPDGAKTADPANGTGAMFEGIDVSNGLYVATRVRNGATLQVNLDGKVWAFSNLPDGFTPGLIDENSDAKVDLAGTVVKAGITLKHTVSSTGDQMFQAEDTGTQANKAVSIQELTLGAASGVPAGERTAVEGALKSKFAELLNEDIKKFENIFHVVNAPGSLQTEMPWMLPKLTEYAAADASGVAYDPAKSVLAFLNRTTTSIQTKPSISQVDPAIIANLPPGANAVVAISPERFTSQVLMRAAYSMVDQPEADSFEVKHEDRVVVNTKALQLGETQLNITGGSATTENPVIPIGGLRLSIIDNYILVELSGLSMKYVDANLADEDTATFGFKQKLFLKKYDTGNKSGTILFPTLKDPNAPPPNPNDPPAPSIFDFKVTATMAPHPDNKLKLGAVLAIVGAVALGVAIILATGYACCANASEAAAMDELADDAINQGVNGAEMDATGVYGPSPVAALAAEEATARQIYSDAPPLLLPHLNLVVSEKELAVAKPVAPLPPLPPGAVFFKARWAVGFSHMTAMAGVANHSDLGLDTAAIQKMTQDNFDSSGWEASVEAFIAKTLASFNWPASTGWTLMGTELKGPLLIYGTIEPQPTGV